MKERVKPVFGRRKVAADKAVVDKNGNAVRSGLRGWLILVGIGVVLTPLRVLAELLNTYLPIFENGSYEILTTPGTEAYHPFWSTLIWGELSFNTIILFAWLYLGYLYFFKKRLFPKVYIWVAVISFAFVLLDASLATVVVTTAEIFNPETIQEFVRAGFLVVVWVPYMLRSKRVKVTFVN